MKVGGYRNVQLDGIHVTNDTSISTCCQRQEKILFHALLLLALLTPIQAHTWSDLNDWLTDWTERYENAWVYQSDYTSLDAELSDMLSRHPDWDGRIVDPPARVPAPASPTTVPGRSTDTSTQPTVSRGMGDGNVEQWRPLVAGQFPPEQVDSALCVINSESGGNPSAKNPRSEARGLFQVMASVWAPHYGFTYAELYEPEKNTWTAAQIWADAGWQPWSPRTRRNCGL